jgi:hypothetical protein
MKYILANEQKRWMGIYQNVAFKCNPGWIKTFPRETSITRVVITKITVIVQPGAPYLTRKS